LLGLTRYLEARGRSDVVDYEVGAGGGGIDAVGFHVKPRIEPMRASMKPMTNPPTVKTAPMIVRTRTRIAPVRTLDLSEEFIITVAVSGQSVVNSIDRLIFSGTSERGTCRKPSLEKNVLAVSVSR
jgi:hypothetical protein